MVKYLLIVCMVGLVAVFQNCTNKQFSARTDLNKSTSLDGSEELVQDDVSPGVGDDTAGGGSASGGSMSGGTTGEGSSTGGGSASEGSSSGGSHSDDDDDDSVAENDDNESENENEQETEDEATSSEDGKKGKKICFRHGNKILANEVGICIVEGQGQSDQISLINDEIVVNNETPKSVCMTAFACRKIVDGKFRVVTLKKTGFCKNGSADSIRLSDQQVRDLINKVK